MELSLNCTEGFREGKVSKGKFDKSKFGGHRAPKCLESVCLPWILYQKGSLSVLEVRPKEIDFRESELTFSRDLGELVGP